MRINNITNSKKAAIVTNNIHCERHYQYFSTIEKYFKFNGWEIVGNFNVNKIVICGCGFHDAMYEKIKRTLDEIKKTNFLEKNIIIMGCLPKTQEYNLKKDFNGQTIDINQEHQLDDLIGATIHFKDIQPVNVFRIHEKCSKEQKENQLFNIKISQGCLKQCTFCVINKAKGDISSVPLQKIIDQVKKAITLDKQKIFFMGEDTFAYGIDIGTTIIDLIEEVIKIDSSLDLYFGYLHIRWLNKYFKDILSLCERRILNELHIGLQHVNDKLLEKMGRPVVFSKTYELIKKIKEVRPDLYMVADIMVGFPGETDNVFNELVEFMKKDTCFNKVKHFAYSDVTGSTSSSFENKIPPEIGAQRWQYLDKILGFRSYSNEVNESRIDNETFRITRFDDYSFCKDTFDDTIEGKGTLQNLVSARTNLLESDGGDFEFN